MDVVSRCPLRTASLLWRRSRGEWMQSVVCKGTFALAPGEAALAEEQEHPIEDDNYWNDDAARSLYVASDLVPWKPKADVLLVGKAFAPRKEPVASLVARLLVAGIDKRIEVWCDRTIAADRSIHEGPRFTSMPLVYERAAGGADTWNPVGIGPQRLPNLQPVGLRAGEHSGPIPPVGFGPIAPSWPGRASLGGASLQWPLGVLQLPDGFDAAFFNAALPDQQVVALRGGEPLVLESLHREHERLVMTLPSVRPRASLEVGGSQRELSLVCDTLWIDTDRALCTLTWRGFIPLQVPDDEGRVVIDLDERPRSGSLRASPGPAVGLDSTQPIQLRSPDSDDTHDAVSMRGARAAVLPFQPSPERSLPSASLPARPALASASKEHFVAPAEQLSIGEAAVLVNQGMPSHLRVPLAGAALPASAFPAPASVPVPAPAPIVAPVEGKAHGSRIGVWHPPGVAAEDDAESARSALGASNAAAGAAPGATGSAEPSALPRPGVEAVEMVWLDASFAERIHRKSAWKEPIAEAKAKAAEVEEDSDSREQKKASRERREALAVLRHGDASGAASLEAQLTAALDAGAVTPPLVLVAGALVFPFDELETLKATMALVVPFASGDKKLKELCDTTSQLLASPWLERGTVGLGGLLLRLREAFEQSARALPPGHLEAHTEQLLLERRCYQKRTVMGQVWIRALLAPSGGGESIPAYLPESLAKELPMFQSFRARLIAELRPQVDQYEAHPIALRAAALGRVITRARA